MPCVIFIALFVTALLVGAVVLKVFWPVFSKRPEPEMGDAFRYVAIAVFVALLIAFFAMLLLLPPSG